MALKPGEDIGRVTQSDTDQFIRFEVGPGKSVIDGKEFELRDGSALVISAGTDHNGLTTPSREPLKLYTLYTRPCTS